MIDKRRKLCVSLLMRILPREERCQNLPEVGYSCIKHLISSDFDIGFGSFDTTCNDKDGGCPSLKKRSCSLTRPQDSRLSLVVSVCWRKTARIGILRLCSSCRQSGHPLRAVLSTRSKVLIRRICFFSGSRLVSLVSVMTTPSGYRELRRAWHFQHSWEFSSREFEALCPPVDGWVTVLVFILLAG